MSHPLVGMIVLLSMECSGIFEALGSTEAATKKQRELKRAKVPYIEGSDTRRNLVYFG